MTAARRPHRASPRPSPATFNRGVAQALAALHGTEPLTPERAAQLEQALAQAPYRRAQAELPLALPDESPQQ